MPVVDIRITGSWSPLRDGGIDRHLRGEVGGASANDTGRSGVPEVFVFLLLVAGDRPHPVQVRSSETVPTPSASG